MKPDIIAVAGKQGAGKDTFCNLLSEISGYPHASTSDYLVTQYAPHVRRSVKAIRANKQAYREGLIWFGNMIARQHGESYLMQQTVKAVKNPHVIVQSFRRLEEVLWLDTQCKYDRVVYVLIDTDRSIREQRRGCLVAENDPTEKEVPEFLLDTGRPYIVTNNGTMEDLERLVRNFADRFGLMPDT